MSMKRSAIIVVLMLLSAFFSACSEKDTDTVSEVVNSDAESSVVSREASEKARDIRTMSSSLKFPLDVEQWGSVSKYSTAEQKYYVVPMRLTAVSRGNKADEIIKTACDGSDWFTFSKAEVGFEWVAAEYEISLDSFPVDTNGADAEVTSFVTTGDGEYIGDKGAVTVVLTDGQYYYEGIQNGVIAWQVPSECADMVLSAGEYGEEQAFFKVQVS